MKGNEALAEAAIRTGVDAFFGYPITPQSEVLEYLLQEDAQKRTGMVVLQTESETASINMVYGAACAGRRAMTSSSSPGISLMSEGISYLAGAELPGVIVNVARGGPGLGTIQPAQSDYFQATKAPGHGDFRQLVLAPASVQEMADFIPLAFDLAFKYRNPVMILSDGVIGQMMEKVYLPEPRPRMTEFPEWATIGKKPGKERKRITSLNLIPLEHEKHNQKLQAKYRQMEAEEIRYEEYLCQDAEYIMVAYGASARIASRAVEMARAKGIRVGLFRPVTLFPFPAPQIEALSLRVKGFLSIEMSAGQMIEDIRLAVGKNQRVEHFGRYGGLVHVPEEILEAFERFYMEPHGH